MAKFEAKVECISDSL